MKFQVSTDYLYARPSFLEGMARAWDFGNTLNEYNESSTPEEADARALASDWLVVGEALREAVQRYRAERDALDKVA